MKNKPMTEKEMERFNELCNDFAQMKSDVRDICTALSGSHTGAKGLVSQMKEIHTQLSQHQIDDEKHFMEVDEKLTLVSTEQKKLKWWAGGIATAAGFIAWLIENVLK